MKGHNVNWAKGRTKGDINNGISGESSWDANWKTQRNLESSSKVLTIHDKNFFKTIFGKGFIMDQEPLFRTVTSSMCMRTYHRVTYIV